MRRDRRCQRGFQLLELLVVLTLFTTVAGLAMPPLLRAAAGARVRLAAAEIAGALRRARAEAIARNTAVAVKFRPVPGSRVTFTLYRDGDGDGVRNRDITAGVDPPLAAPRTLAHLGRAVRFGFPAGGPYRDPAGQPLDRRDDPVRFNRSDLASFGPLGTGTPGSLYLTDGGDHFAVVRVLGRTGKVRTLIYDFARRRWR